MCDEKRLVENCGCGCGGLHRLQLLDWHGLFRNGRRTVQLEGVAVDFVQENWIALSTLVVMLWGADLSKSMKSNWAAWVAIAAVIYFLWQRQHRSPINKISQAQGVTTTTGGTQGNGSKPGSRGGK